MLATAIAALFALTAIIAALVIADCLIRARAAYVQLAREAEWLALDIPVQPAARALRPGRPRSAARRITPDRRSAMLQARPVMLGIPACAAA